MSFNPNMANREVANLVWCDYKTKAPVLNLNYANVTTTGLTASRVFAKGGTGAPNRVGFDGERSGTLKIDTQITPMELYGLLSGSGVSASAKYIKRIETETVSKEFTLKDTPAPGTVFVYKQGDDCGTPLEITVADKAVTVNDTAFTDGSVIAYYIVVKDTGAQTVKFTSKNFPKAFTIYGDTPWKTEDEEIVAMKLTYYKAQPQASFELAFSNSGEPTSLSITLDLLADENNDIYDMSVIEDEDE